MPVITKAAAQAEANTVKNETVANANSATRVGGVLLDVVDSVYPNGTPTPGYVYTADASGLPQWLPSGGLTVNSFVPAATLYETSQSVVNPSFTASYNVTPTTALLTNDANGESLDVHATPTAFSSAQTYQKTTPNQAVTWTLTTSNGTRAASATWGQRTFGGVVVAGSSQATLIAAATYNTLGTARAFSFTVTGTGGTSRAQFIYPARYGTPSTVKDNATGFAIAYTLLGTATYTNAQGFGETYNQYETVSSFTGSLTLVIT